MKKIAFFTFCLLIISCGGKRQASFEIDLSGEWTYCILESADSYSFNNTTCRFKTVRLPENDLLNILSPGKKGFVLFRKVFVSGNVPDMRLLFQAGEIMNADRVYINGKLIGSSGRYPPDFRSAWSKFRSYPVQRGVIKSGENTLDVLVYFNAELWITRPLRIIGRDSGIFLSIERRFWQIEFMQAFSLLLVCFAGFFMLFFFKRRSEKVYLYFSLCSLAIADMITLQYLENLYPNINISSNAVLVMTQSGLVCMPPFLSFFFREYLGKHVRVQRLIIYLIPPLATILLMAVSPDRSGILYWRNLYLLLVPAYIADVIIVSLRRIFAGRREGMLMFFGILPILIFGIRDVLVFSFHMFDESMPMYIFGVPLMIVVIALHLANRFINSLNLTEKLNEMLKEKMEEGKRLASLDKELSIARKIQLAAVPRSIPDHPAFSVYVKYVPAENISGDFYNFHMSNERGIGIFVADVSGHGVPASLIASMVKILFSVLVPVAEDPVMFLRGINTYLYDKIEGNFLTAGYCFLNSGSKTGFYSRTGHEPLIHLRKKGKKVNIKKYLPRGMAAGIVKEVTLEKEQFSFNSGDRFVLYTDCIVETLNSEKDMFGEGRLDDLLRETIDMEPEECAEHIYSSLKKWSRYTGSDSFEDDFTLLIIDVL